MIKLKAERDILKKAAAYFAEKIDVKFGSCRKHLEIWPAGWLCEALGVSRGGFYASAQPGPCRPAQPAVTMKKLGAKVRSKLHLPRATDHGARRV